MAISSAASAAAAFVLKLLVAAALAVDPITAGTAAGVGGLPRLEHPTKSDGSLSVLVVGDWGRKGLYNQSLVAFQMGRTGEEMEVDFVISTGDNMYEDGLAGVDDEAFEESFTSIYTAKSLQVPWYTVLGNHDYRGDALAQLSPVLRHIDGRFICMRSFLVNAEIVDFFFVDTTPFVLKYWTRPGKQTYDWRGVAPRMTYISNLLRELDGAMKESAAVWKIVVGHHTMRSVGMHGDTEELVQLLLPLLHENGAHLYVNGHDHCLEHISSKDSPVQFLTTGGGSKAWRGAYTPDTRREKSVNFFYDGQGFMSLHFTKSQLDVSFYDVLGRALYTWSTAAASQSSTALSALYNEM